LKQSGEKKRIAGIVVRASLQGVRNGRMPISAEIPTNAGARAGASRARCVAAFATAAERLAEVHGNASALSGQLRSLMELVAGDRDDQTTLKAVREAAHELRAAIQQRADDDGARSVIEARAALGDIEAEARRLAAVAALTQITAQSLAAFGLNDYVAGLRSLNGALADDAEALNDGVESLSRARSRAKAAMARASSGLAQAIVELERAQPAPNEIAAAMAATRRNIADAEASMSDAIARETTALIAAIQFSDSMAQRLEHIETMLGMTQGREAAVGSLAAAQLRALHADACKTCDAADAALQRIALAATRANDAFRGDGGEGSADAIMRRRRAGLQKALACDAELAPALSEAQQAAAEIRDRLSEALSRFANLGRSAAEINLSAINATLLTARSGTAKAPLGVLSEAVREGARACATRSKDCNAALAALSEGLDEGRLVAVQTSMNGFHAAVRACEADLAEAEQAASQLALMRDAASDAADALGAAVGVARRALAQVPPVLGEAAAFGAELDGGSTEGVDLSDIDAIYTMDRERDVHAGVVGVIAMARPAVAPAAPAPADVGDVSLDSILF
jgi:hypothetical protein